MDRIAVLIRKNESFLLLEDEEEKSPIMRQIEKGETLREAVRNEARSITGAEIEFVDKITKTEIGDGNERIHWYIAGEKPPTEEEPEPEKVDVSQDHGWYTMEELEESDLNTRLETFLNDFSKEIKEL